MKNKEKQNHHRFLEQENNHKDLFLESLKHIEVGNNPPHLVSIIGPNRSGTTAFAEIFARLGIPNYLQPIKSIRRAIEEDDEIPSFSLHQDTPLAVHKETLGSSQESEFFDPILALLTAGYPPEKIHLITILRDPTLTLTSWNRIYQDNVNPQGLVRAVHLTEQIAVKAQSLGVNVSHYVHEAIRDNPADVVADAIFQQAGIQLPPNLVSHSVDWRTGPTFGSDESTAIFYDKPPEIFIQGVKERSGYQYNYSQQASITLEQQTLLEESGAIDVYNKFKALIQEETGLIIK